MLESKIADSKYRQIVFVCRGSTCRSPTAKVILRHLTQERKDRNEWKIESAGTHVFREGLQSNERGLQVLKKHGIASNHGARKVKEDDFRHCDVILAFDESNVRHLNETFKPNDGTKRAEVKLFGTYKLHSDMQFFMVYSKLYNKLSYARILIGSHL